MTQTYIIISRIFTFQHAVLELDQKEGHFEGELPEAAPGCACAPVDLDGLTADLRGGIRQALCAGPNT